MKFLLKFFTPVILFILLYIGISSLLMLFPANTLATQKNNQPGSSQINQSIYLTHDLAHVNFLIDLSHSAIEWHQLIPELVPGKKGHLLIGWGDQQTYQSTPDWSDLKVSVALQALLMNTPSVLHLRYLPDNQYLRVSIVKLLIDAETSRALEKNILNSFGDDNKQMTPVIKPRLLASGYDVNDRFYHTSGSYNLFKTCNTWVGDVLRQSGIPVSYWTPLSYNVIYSIPATFKKDYDASNEIIRVNFH